MKKAGYCIIALSSLLLAACMPLKSKQAPPSVYLLHARIMAQPRTTPACVITVQEPEVPPGFDTERMALYLYGGRRLDYYAGAVWPEPLGKTLQAVMINEAQNSPKLTAARPGAVLSAAYSLSARFDDFEPVYPAGPARPPLLKISVNYSVVSLGDQKIIYNAALAEKAMASANTQTDVVAGLETLLQKTIEKMYGKMAPQLCPPPLSLSAE